MKEGAQLPSGHGYHWCVTQRRVADDAVLDALETAKLAEIEAEFRRPPGHTTGIEPNSTARPGRAVSDAQRELDRLVAWIDELIDRKFGPFTR